MDVLAAGQAILFLTECRVSLQDLSKEIREINTANGWNVTQPFDWKYDYKIPAVCALIHTEISEAVEAFRKNDEANFLEELADTLIRTLDVAGGFTDDFDSIVRAKLDKNRQRGYKHGGKRV